MADFLTFMGLIFMVTLTIFIVYGIVLGIKEGIYELKRRYRYKHRFDKPPTAKCYCLDCKHHDKKTRRCYRFKKEYRCTADNWFCWEAEPREVLEE